MQFYLLFKSFACFLLPKGYQLRNLEKSPFWMEKILFLLSRCWTILLDKCLTKSCFEGMNILVKAIIINLWQI